MKQMNYNSNTQNNDNQCFKYMVDSLLNKLELR